jgi:H+/Cl- antiporter ClcA
MLLMRRAFARPPTQVYSIFAAMAAGSCISSGLLVPMLIMGACIGRFCGARS